LKLCPESEHIEFGLETNCRALLLHAPIGPLKCTKTKTHNNQRLHSSPVRSNYLHIIPVPPS
jgi:hypothetical protein